MNPEERIDARLKYRGELMFGLKQLQLVQSELFNMLESAETEAHAAVIAQQLEDLLKLEIKVVKELRKSAKSSVKEFKRSLKPKLLPRMKEILENEEVSASNPLRKTAEDQASQKQVSPERGSDHAIPDDTSQQREAVGMIRRMNTTGSSSEST